MVLQETYQALCVFHLRICSFVDQEIIKKTLVIILD